MCDASSSSSTLRATERLAHKHLKRLYLNSQLVFTPECLCVTCIHQRGAVLLQQLPASQASPTTSASSPPHSNSPAGRLQSSLVGRRWLLCGEQVAPLSAAPVVRSAALIFINDSSSHKSKSGGARGAAPHSFNFLLWETEGLWGSGEKQEVR